MQEAVITGFTSPKGGRKHFGFLVIGVYNGENLRYAGHVGTGFDEKSLSEPHQRLTALQTPELVFEQIPNRERNTTWVKPVLVCNIKYTEWTEEKQLRHPVF